MKTNTVVDRPRKLIHHTPLRYPGGKSKLAPFIKSLIEHNHLLDGHYVEPYAGGAGVALELLFHEYVSHIHINDVSRPIWAFWSSILTKTDEFSRLVKNTKISVGSWDKQKKILKHSDDFDDLQVGFATFFLNRTNRSGILNGGIIGGRDQTGPWKINARFNPPELIYRIESIASLRKKISLSREDAVAFLKRKAAALPSNTLIYLDPPYYVKGKDLYLSFYSHEDHVEIAKLMATKIKRQNWIISYDNVAPIRKLYSDFSSISYRLNYSARVAKTGSEVMFFSEKLDIPEPSHTMTVVRRNFKNA